MNKEELEEGLVFAPRYDEKGLIPCVTVHAQRQKVIMFAFMNDLSVRKTIETGEAHYWSRSRNELWHKGASSGLVHRVVEMRVDCDQDCLVLKVDIPGDIQGSCHTGREGCFYRSIPLDQNTDGDIKLEFVDDALVFDPKDFYKNNQ